MTTWGLAVDGVDVGEYAAIPDSLAPFMTAPAPRGRNLVVAGRHGEAHIPRKFYEANSFVLLLWVKGALPNGTVPPGSSDRAELYARADELVSLFPIGKLVTLDRTLPAAAVRRALVEVTHVIDFKRDLGWKPVYAKVAISLAMPGAFWFDISTATSGPHALATGGTVQLAGFAGATAPMDELVVTFGPGNNPKLSQPSTGFFVAYDGVIGSGQSLILNTASSTPLVGTGGLVVDYSKLRYSGSSRFFELRPQPSAAGTFPGAGLYPGAGTFPGSVAPGPTVSLTHTTGGTMTVTVAGPRKYLTS